MTEFRHLSTAWEGKPKVYDVELDEDRADRWRFKVRGFDESSPGGRELNADLARLERERGRDHIVMEVNFPAHDYPARPFSLRCVSPRFMWYTGHVTAGGSICIEALTTDGSPNAWRPTHCVEAVLQTVFANMVYCDVGWVRTANGGGRTGPLRVDLDRRYSHDVLMDYSRHEADSSFQRMLHHHRTHGW